MILHLQHLSDWHKYLSELKLCLLEVHWQLILHLHHLFDFLKDLRF
uniref:Uncharacterized protein n=1 Tax=Arcella intermedia TaxID=1963864 RepID=A0A6B2LWI0_9EUKA